MAVRAFVGGLVTVLSQLLVARVMVAGVEKPKSAYRLFSKSRWEEVRQEKPGASSAPLSVQTIAADWSGLSDAERAPWEKLASEERERYADALPPPAPKRALSAYMFYVASRRVALLKEEPGLKITEISKRLGAEWRKLSDKDKAPWQKKATQDKRRYAEEKEAYEEEHGEIPKKGIQPWKRIIRYRPKRKGKVGPFTVFCKEHFHETRKELGMVPLPEVAKVLGKRWRELPRETKDEYVKKAALEQKSRDQAAAEQEAREQGAAEREDILRAAVREAAREAQEEEEFRREQAAAEEEHKKQVAAEEPSGIAFPTL